MGDGTSDEDKPFPSLATAKRPGTCRDVATWNFVAGQIALFVAVEINGD